MDRLRLLFLTLIVSAAVSVAPRAIAVDRSITFANPVGIVRTGDLFSIDVLLTNLEQAINAIDLTIRYPIDRLSVVNISRAQSAFMLWPEAPRTDKVDGTVHIVGGIPNGLYAKDARVVTIIMTALQPGTAAVSLDTQSSFAYLNDGSGTQAGLASTPTAITVVSDFTPGIQVASTSQPDANVWSANATVTLAWDRLPETQYSYAFGADGQVVPDDVPDDLPDYLTFADLADGRYSFTIKSRPVGGVWSTVTQRWFLIDRTPPESFQIEQLPPASVGGRQVIAWAAVDRMSGVVKAELFVGDRSQGLVQSPLRLNPQWAGKTLTIRLSDAAGNAQTAAWLVPGLTRPWWTRWVAGARIVLIIAVLAVFWLIRRR